MVPISTKTDSDDVIGEYENASSDSDYVSGFRQAAMSALKPAIPWPLEKSVGHEINFVYSVWGYEFERAFQAAVSATEALSGRKELKPYRATRSAMSSMVRALRTGPFAKVRTSTIRSARFSGAPSERRSRSCTKHE
jgi:hypothetical protein